MWFVTAQPPKEFATEERENTEQTEGDGADGSWRVICPCSFFRYFRLFPFVPYALFPGWAGAGLMTGQEKGKTANGLALLTLNDRAS
jgi:hypothetical protein